MIQTHWIQSEHKPGIRYGWDERGRLEIDVAAVAIANAHYRVDNHVAVVSDDLRSLVKPSDQLDERGIYSILQFGAIIPPLSPWKEIRRAVPGSVTKISDMPIRVETKSSGTPTCFREGECNLPKEAQIDRVVSCIDQFLMVARQSRPLVILFSGGVDSGLLAARAASLGLSDTVLVNYCFGPGDEESNIAERMAEICGLRFERVVDVTTGADIEDLLSHAGIDYRIPFCDHSVLPTRMLLKSVLREFGATHSILDGTGADGAFGLINVSRQWRKMARIPVKLCKCGSALYKMCRLWEAPSRFEYTMRLLRRCCQHSYPWAAVVQNPLMGVAYHVSDEVHREVSVLCRRWMESISPDEPFLQLATIDLAFVCSNIFAQKSYSLCANVGIDIKYPYLDAKLVQMALWMGRARGIPQEPKWLLKAALARHIPPSMVYRVKSGFTAPIAQKFRTDAFINALDKVISGASPVSPYIEKQFFAKVRKSILRSQPLPFQTTATIWAAVFSGEWLAQTTSAANK